MIQGLDNIIAFLRENRCNYFQVRQAPDKDWFIFRPNDEESTEERFERFKRIMAISEHERMFIEAWETKGQTKNWCRTWFTLGKQTNISAPAQISGAPSYSMEDIEEKVSRKVEAILQKRELEDLRAENKLLTKELDAMEKERETVKEKVLTAASPYIGQIVSLFAGKILPNQPQIAVAGLPGDNSVSDCRLDLVLTRLEALDPDYIIILEQLADIGESNPVMIATAKTMLNNLHASL